MNKTKILTGALSLGIAGAGIFGVTQFTEATEEGQNKVQAETDQQLESKYTDQEMEWLKNSAETYQVSVERIAQFTEFVYDVYDENKEIISITIDDVYDEYDEYDANNELISITTDEVRLAEAEGISFDELQDRKREQWIAEMAETYGVSPVHIEKVIEFHFDDETGGILGYGIDAFKVAEAAGMDESEVLDNWAESLGYESYDDMKEKQNAKIEAEGKSVHWTEKLSIEQSNELNEQVAKYAEEYGVDVSVIWEVADFIINEETGELESYEVDPSKVEAWKEKQ